MPGSAALKAHITHTDRTLRGTLQRLWHQSYAPDWLSFLFLSLSNLLLALRPPFQRLFSLDDENLHYPHATTERVPVPLLLLYTVLLPALAIPAFTFLHPRKTPREKLHQAHVGILGLSISLITTVFVTDTIKNLYGRPRPDLLDRCQPRAGTLLHELVSAEVCTQPNDHVLRDGFRSFPSGHSSFSWSGLGFLSLFLLGQLRASGPRGDMCRVLIGVSPAFGALLISLSRTEDYRHDIYDVCAGAFIGGLVTYWSYRRYFPSLTSPECDSPLPHRVAEKDGEDYAKTEFEMIPTRPSTPDLEMGQRV